MTKPLVINRKNFIEMCQIVTEKDEVVFKDLFKKNGIFNRLAG
ncbi:MAG: hypothetical protein Ct9H90mP2_02120 [Dehalococcoidia bacterium]|nr:MAG: hypothetical protein Ct9H90mP2_02120 [Dehalococcoidia bacterium]